jgi:hypothetical protein
MMHCGALSILFKSKQNSNAGDIHKLKATKKRITQTIIKKRKIDMKTPILKFLHSTAAKGLLAVTIITLVSVTACKKSADTTAATVTEADATELTTDAIVPTTGGMTIQASSSVNIYAAASTKLACGVSKDTTITGASVAGAVPSYNYSLSWNYKLNCDVIPTTFTFNFTGSSNYSGLLLTSNDSSTGTFVVSTTLAAANYTVNTSYERKGTQTSKVGQQKSFTSGLKITSTNVLISKTTNEIVSGTGTVSLTGVTTGGKSFSFGGTITFLGNKKATVLFNSGVSHSIQ